jgi:hypothetical protein
MFAVSFPFHVIYVRKLFFFLLKVCTSVTFADNSTDSFSSYLLNVLLQLDRLCGLVVRVLGYRSGGLGSIPGTTKKKVVGLERGPLSLVSTTEELLDRTVAAPV